MDTDSFRRAMGSFPSGVTIATTTDPAGQPCGITVSAFCSVSLSPPLVLFCPAVSARSHDVLRDAERYAINVLRPEHRTLAMRFATAGTDKFARAGFRAEGGVPVLPSALVSVVCRASDRYDAGDHSILVGEVESVHVNDGQPLVYFDREFRELSPAPLLAPPGRVDRYRDRPLFDTDGTDESHAA
ncbi:flavin reductase family protein [Streptomyces tubercidicus]|uniref:Actinorhodin polyketide dimerase n=1 Tax=Streptomyces tubercidicus TaxID=47759 RepID=A0A640UKW7_9ACTN|nr:flavin reductase family protein [Streptomyces tubercidicus]WAU11459.1 flavin reductase family protein [Streptomyces tubercidicus]GFE36738.1 actinorhodin polyketide dimerase [Streptomyces tubercidicus]